MSDSLGQISLKVNEPYELQMYGEDIYNEVGKQVRLLVENSYITAQKILNDHRDLLDQVASALLEKETISEEEFEEFFK
jgi:cell division protease FtsH